MARAAATRAPKQSSRKKIPSKKSPSYRAGLRVRRIFVAIRNRNRRFLMRRPHRSFRRTRRRDYRRSLKLPGYWAFTLYVFGVLRRRAGLFIAVALLYAVFAMFYGGMTSQDTYGQLNDLLTQGASEAFSGAWGKIGQAGLLATAALSGGTNILSETQQIYVGIIVLLTWLTIVWLLRSILAGQRPRLRDGLYNASAPFISTLIVAVVLLAQLLPIGLLAVAFAGLSGAGLIDDGFARLLFSSIAIIVVSMTMYWVTSTFIALVVVTLPGMYPGRALTTASDMVVGRRLRIMYRLIWMLLVALLAWFVVVVPLVLFDTWWRGAVDWAWLEWVPVMPFLATLASSLTAIWVASYVYLLYRKVVDDDAAPA